MDIFTPRLAWWDHRRTCLGGSSERADQWISTNNALTVLWWKHICLARKLPTTASAGLNPIASTLLFAVDTRNRLIHTLNIPYLENASILAGLAGCPQH